MGKINQDQINLLYFRQKKICIQKECNNCMLKFTNCKVPIPKSESVTENSKRVMQKAEDLKSGKFI